LRGDPAPTGTLSEKFIVPPFSVLLAKSGEWQTRKQAWLACGLRGEEGRAEKLVYKSLSSSIPDYYDQKDRAEAIAGRKLETKEFEEKFLDSSGKINETSIFDPVLCEVIYSWFTKAGDKVLDPFAGGSTRGIVAAMLGREYWGFELRSEQVEANKKQSLAFGLEFAPNWVDGDSRTQLDGTRAQGEVDFIFSCPPYVGLEKYSDDPSDLSNMPWPEFLKAYREIIAHCYRFLGNNRFAVLVIGECRDVDGNYYNLVGETIRAFLDAGFSYYNEIILETQVGTAAIRCGRFFKATRKVCKVHQNVLVFVKGDGKEATQRLGDVEVCSIEQENAEE